MPPQPHDRKPPSADTGWSRGTALAILAVIVMLMSVAAFGWSQYRGAESGDPRVEILPTTPTSVDSAGAGSR